MADLTDITLAAGQGVRIIAAPPIVVPPVDPPPVDTIPHGSFLAEYFENLTLAGTPKVKTNVIAIGLDWKANAPIGLTPTDGWSGRFTGWFPFEAGEYAFTATADDGVRVYIDGNRIIDVWVNQSADHPVTAKATLTAGEHKVLVEYFENTGLASLAVTWTPVVVVVPPPVDPPPAAGAFLSYPALAARGSDGQVYALYDSPTDLAISKVKVAGIGAGKRAIVIRNPKGTLTLQDIDFENVGICFYIVGGGALTDLRILRCRARGILGPHASMPNMGNFLQLNDTIVGGRIGDNLILVKSGGCEDVISITGTSGGTSSMWLDIEDNRIDGTGWTSNSGSGIAASDGHGGYTRVRRNKFTNPGQVGFFFASAGPHIAEDNIVYSRAATKSGQADQPFYVANYGAENVHDVSGKGNIADWLGADGGKRGGYIDRTAGPNITIPGATIQTIDPASIAVVL